MKNDNLYIYDIEIFKHDWVVVLNKYESKEFLVFHNDYEGLIKALEKVNMLVGFNNYSYDDYMIYYIAKKRLSNKDLFEKSQELINGKKPKLDTSTLATIDVMQELQLGVGLKAIEGYLGKYIKESELPFDIDRLLTKNEIMEVCNYCCYDVMITKEVFKLRSSYFTAKSDIISEFKLEPLLIKKTRAYLVSKVLKSSQNNFKKENDRLDIRYVDTLNFKNIPFELLNFYNTIIKDFKNGVSYEELEKRNLKLDIAGVEHSYGFGGVHGGLEGFIYEGDILYLDFSSYYPSLMIEYNFLSRACSNKDDYKNLYNTRFALKKAGDSKEYIYKILLNATYGATKFEYNSMFDPVQANNICINGQLIITDLALRIANFGSLVQTNTDGLMFIYQKENLSKIEQIMRDFEKEYRLTLGVKHLKAIYQRDVNNYIIVQNNGKVSGIGRFKNWNIDNVNFETYNLSIIDIALKRYYVDKIPIEDTINKLLKDNQLLPFQIIAKCGSKFEYLAQYKIESDNYTKLNNKVNRVFATKLKSSGAIYKVRNNSYNKVPNIPDYTYIHNDSIESMSASLIDKDYYINLVKNSMVENKKLKVKRNKDDYNLNIWTL